MYIDLYNVSDTSHFQQSIKYLCFSPAKLSEQNPNELTLTRTFLFEFCYVALENTFNLELLRIDRKINNQVSERKLSKWLLYYRLTFDKDYINNKCIRVIVFRVKNQQTESNKMEKKNINIKALQYSTDKRGKHMKARRQRRRKDKG